MSRREDDDALAALRAQADQAKAGTSDFAEIVANFYTVLRRLHVPPDHALFLSNTFLTQTMGGSSK